LLLLNLSALDPGKQGLKLSPFQVSLFDPILSALDPGKQGLKLFGFHPNLIPLSPFSA